MLGELIGRGRTAEVYALGADRVVKLMLPGFDAAPLAVEGAKTGAAHAAGVPAPDSHGPVEIDGRPGWVFDRAPGQSLLDRIISGPWRCLAAADLLADLHVDMHSRTAPDLVDVRDRLADAIGRAEPLEAPLRSLARDSLLRLAAGDRVLHGDFHPGNVMVDQGRATVIDWLDASRGTPAADVARTLWLSSPAVIPPGMAARRIVVMLSGLIRKRYSSRYLAATGLDPTEVARWRLPVLAARLSEGIAYEEAALVAEVRRLSGR